MSAFSNIWKIKELRERILFTLGLVFICRMLAIVPTPGVDASELAKAILPRYADYVESGLFRHYARRAYCKSACSAFTRF